MNAERRPAMSSGEETVRQSISEVKALMGRMGARSFDPLPPTQHQWQRGKGWPDVLRLWSWMCAHTIHWGHRSEYAVDHEGNELHIENAAEALKIDIANCYRAWNRGVKLTLWRAGTPKEGKRRLYFAGMVDLTKAEEEGEEKENQNVCTDILPPYILKQIKELAPESREKFTVRYILLEKAERGALAEAVAAVRDVFTKEKDNTFAAFGLQKRRLELKAPKGSNGASNGHAEASDAPAASRPITDGCRQAILPLVEMYVQTFAESVQTDVETQYKVGGEACTAPVSLLSQKVPEKSQRRDAGGRDMGHSSRVKTPPLEGQSALKQQYAEPAPELPEAERKALALLFSKTQEMQDAYPHTKFGSVQIRVDNKGDVVWGRKVLAALGDLADVEGFCYQVAVELGCQPGSLGMLPRTKTRTPAQNPHDRYLGLILEWADDYAHDKPKREIERVERALRQDAIEAREKAHAEQEAAEASAYQQAETDYAALPEPEKANLRVLARASLRADPRWHRISTDMREAEVERYAFDLFRRRLGEE